MHPFGLTVNELEEVLKPSSVDKNSSQELPPNSNASLPVTTQVNREEGEATTLAVGEEGGDLPPPIEEDVTTERMGEEGGMEPEESRDVMTMALGEEGGMEPQELPPPPEFPDPTGILAEQGGFISDPLPLANTEGMEEEPGVVTTMAIGEEGGVITSAEGEDGEMPDFDEPMEPTTLAVGEEGGDVQIAEVQTLGATPDNGILEVVTAAIGEPGGFDADVYGELYPQLIDAVNSGVIPSLLDHYEAFGQFEPERIGIFVGNFSYDRVTAFGNNTIISGVSIVGYDPIAGDFIFGGNGSGEFDVLVGESSLTSTELFILGNSQSQPFYIGSGDVDFALIQNFDVGSDRIQLSGFLEDYNFQIVDNSTRISTAAGDLVAIVENVPNIQDATLIFEG